MLLSRAFALLLLVCAAQESKPAPTSTTSTTQPAEPEHLKVSVEKTTLVESPEMLQNCRKALAAARDTKEAWTKRNEIVERFDMEMASKPVAKMKPEEGEQRDLGKRTLAEFEGRYPRMATGQGAMRFIAEVGSKAEAVCSDATTALLSEGTLLTVVRRKEELINVRVETGRAAGKNGYVLPSDVKPE